jgi:3-hydroxyisobutyrate dehydrogenase
MATIKNIAFIGLGIMGAHMVRNLLQNGYAVTGFSRTKAKCMPLIEDGMQWADTVSDCVAGADLVLTMVGYPDDVAQVYFGEGGILSAAAPQSILVDFTTSSPELAMRIFAAAQERGFTALDAPVSGGDIGARDGSLSIMVGGMAEAFEKVRPVFEVLGKTIALMGGAGAGQHTKMINQIVIAGTIMGVSEALAYAQASGLDQKRVLDIISGGAAGGYQLSVLGKRMLEGDFEPGFYIHHFQKDMKIAAEEAEKMGLDLKALSLAQAQYQEMADKGQSHKGTQALYTHYLQAAERDTRP